MNSEIHKENEKFNFWKNPAKVEKTYMSDFKQVSIYWCLLALFFIITVNIFSPVGTKTHLYKSEMTRVIYEDDDAMTRLPRDERTSTKQGEQK